jgi:DNA-binding SARP family transcriptional activator
MEANVVDCVEMPVETALMDRDHDTPALTVRMFGPLTIIRNDAPLALPASRKVRALFAYLALTPNAVTRSHLCELLWDVPNDPRGELRWCLSKIRGLIDQPGRCRVETRSDTVKLDLNGCFVDAIEIATAIGDAEAIDPTRLRTLSTLLSGNFLDGLDIDRSPVFGAWLTAQRRRFRGFHAALLERLVQSVPDEDVLDYLGQWLELAPFGENAHGFLFKILARRGQIREGDEHLAATIRLFESEGLDGAPLRSAWRSAKAQRGTSTRVPPAAAAPTEARSGEPDSIAHDIPRRASVAVMPFVDRSAVKVVRGGAADGLAFDVIARLAKLRSMFVIAQGTVFALHERNVGPEAAARMLNVDYVVSGSVQRQGNRLSVMVELIETRSARIAWTEIFNHTLDDAFLVLDEIGNRIVSSIATEIETVERNRAVLKPPSSLDAWEAHHRGLWHIYRFTHPDNELAQHFFNMAIRLDPTFSRAHAGLSFTHWQNAFQGWAQRDTEIEKAYAAASQSLMVDDRDPAAHWAMGRALLLRGRQDQSIIELERAIDLSPNFALGHYMVSLVHAQSGDPSAALSASDLSRRLSPFDPLLFGPLAARAMALVRLGRFDEAAEWSLKAASRPNAHAHIQAIAALSLALAGRREEAQRYLAAIRKTVPQYRLDDFLTAMQFAPDGEKLFRDGARDIDMP